jgi:hypothetical protein
MSMPGTPRRTPGLAKATPKRIVATLVIASAMLAAGAATINLTATPSPPGAGSAGTLHVCPPIPQRITSAQARPPLDACGIESQLSMDVYSWFTFLAMSWPADPAGCGPDLDRSVLSGAGPVVWETYLEDSDVFVPRGSEPEPWCRQGGLSAARRTRLPAAVQALARGLADPVKVLSATSKVTPGLDLTAIEQALGGPLTDQAGNFVRYEIRMNESESRYLVEKDLWSQAGQAAFAGTVSLPQSSYANGDVYDPAGEMGAMEVKAAWKVLSDEEKASGRFYEREAIVTDEDGRHPERVHVGLVGLHIIHKTASKPTFLWSTFEHEDNAPTLRDRHLAASYSFNDPGCSLADCPPDQQTFLGRIDERPLPVQVWRTTPIEPEAVQANALFHHLVQGSVWEHYRLVGTQWSGEIPTPQPLPLANPVIETYIQSYSNCTGCHSGATLAVCGTAGCAAGPTAPAGSDFSFLLGEAQ